MLLDYLEGDPPRDEGESELNEIAEQVQVEKTYVTPAVEKSKKFKSQFN